MLKVQTGLYPSKPLSFYILLLILILYYGAYKYTTTSMNSHQGVNLFYNGTNHLPYLTRDNICGSGTPQ